MSTSGSTKKPDVAPSNKQDLMPARELFYPNDPLVGSLLSLNPFALFGWLMLAAVVLILFAKVAGVFSIPLASGNVGFWYSYNWSIMYLFIVPLIFAIASSITSSLPKRIKDVTKPAAGTGCIVPTHETANHDYAADFRDAFAKGSIVIIVGACIVALTIDGWDSWNLWNALIHKSAIDERLEYRICVRGGKWVASSKLGRNIGFRYHGLSFPGSLYFFGVLLGRQVFFLLHHTFETDDGPEIRRTNSCRKMLIPACVWGCVRSVPSLIAFW